MAKQPPQTGDAAGKGTDTESAEIARVLAEIALRSDHIVKEHLAKQATTPQDENPDEIGVGKAFTNLATQMMADPYKLAEAGISHDAHVEIGQPAQTISDFATRYHCGMIVIGTRGHGAIDSMVVGSVANKVVHLSKVPVLLVK